MKSPKKSDSGRSILITLKKLLPGSPGSVLVYLVVILLIFGVLGATIVSLFSTSLTSSATPNYSRRAFYMAESGIRYALSELRNSNFAADTINNLNSLTYTVEKGGSFNLTVFGYWFKSPVYYDTNTQVVLDMAAGEIPEYFLTIPSNLYVVNFNFVGLKPDKPGQTATVVSIPSQTSNSITVNINEQFIANKGELICVAVHPYDAQNNLNSGDNLNVSLEAQDYFPEQNGVIFINGHFYIYETSKRDGTGTYVELNNLSQLPPASGFPFSIVANDFVILAPNNYLIIADGESETENVKYGGDLDFSENIYDLNYPVSGKRKADISFTEMNLETGLSQVETSPNLIQTDDDSKTISIGGGGGQDDFGGTWYNENKAIGGDNNQCTTDGCLFGEGIRAFFVLNFESQGDGIAFALANGINNTANSIGGDIDLSELLAYAGDSRLVANPDVPLDASQYLDSEGKGLQPPKIAVEFDTRTNNDPLDYCAGPLPDNINVNTRNDPGSGDKDAVQYVFWGRPDSLIIPCRDNSPLYDDNKHDPEDVPTEFWPPFQVAALQVVSSPAVDPNEGTVYVGSTGFINLGRVYAINLENGTEKWQFTPEDPKGIGDIDVESSPALDANGNVYIGSDDSFLYALNKNDGNKIWRFDAGVSVESTPAVSESRETVYVEAESFFLYAVNNTEGPQQGLQSWALDIDRCGLSVSNDDEIESSPVIGPDGTLYVGSKDGCLYAVNHDDRFADDPSNPTFPVAGREWMFSTGAEIRSTPVVDDNGTPADRSDDTIYVGSDDGNVYAVSSNGSPKGLNWPFSAPAGPVRSSPALDANGNIYVGSDDGHLYAIDPDGNEKWRFPDPGAIGAVQSSPVVDSDGVVYVGSNDGNVYAINPDGTEKWHFPTGGAVISSPANSGGVIFVGSNDRFLWAINQFIEPRNIKFKLLTAEDLGPNLDIGTDDDWLNGDAFNLKPWAVRLEVKRDEETVEGIGKNVYRLSLWLRQCTDLDCSNIIGTSYQDTRINYDVGFDGTSGLPNLPMTQQFELSDADHIKFERFRWGFTSAVDASQTQNLTLSQFQLSFIRPADPSIATDIVWNEELGL